jgi:hypothetical protein
MAEAKEKTQQGGIGLMGLMFILFLSMKLLGLGVVASWSWWWVTAPLWGPLAFILGFLAVVGIGCMLVVVVGKMLTR